MTKRNTFLGIGGIALAIISGLIGAFGSAYSMGADQQKLKDELVATSLAMTMMQEDNKSHEAAIEKELDRYATIIAAQTQVLHDSIRELTDTVGNLRTDVGVLKALIERMENDLRSKTSSN